MILDYTQYIIDYACEKFGTDDPTPEQLEQAQKEYEDLVESSMKNWDENDTN